MRYEAEMIQPLKSFLVDRLNMDAVEEEFSAGYGIADIVGIKSDWLKLKSRCDVGAEPVTNVRELSILSLFQKNNPAAVEVLAGQIGLSVSYVKQKLLKSLVEKGVVQREGKKYQLVKDIFSYADAVISVEAKLTKWRDALAQAKRYQHFANKVYVALPDDTVKRIDRDLFIENNIGVLSVRNDRVEIEIESQWMKPKTFEMHLYCSEVFLVRQKVFR